MSDDTELIPEDRDPKVVVEGADVYEAIGKLPDAMLRRYGRPVPFTVVRIEQEIPNGDIDDDEGPVRLTAIARP